jgi:hypothetical protein
MAAMIMRAEKLASGEAGKTMTTYRWYATLIGGDNIVELMLILSQKY